MKTSNTSVDVMLETLQRSAVELGCSKELFEDYKDYDLQQKNNYLKRLEMAVEKKKHINSNLKGIKTLVFMIGASENSYIDFENEIVYPFFPSGIKRFPNYRITDALKAQIQERMLFSISLDDILNHPDHGQKKTLHLVQNILLEKVKRGDYIQADAALKAHCELIESGEVPYEGDEKF